MIGDFGGELVLSPLSVSVSLSSIRITAAAFFAAFALGLIILGRSAPSAGGLVLDTPPDSEPAFELSVSSH